MGIILFEHNQKAYDEAVAMMEEAGKAAVIHPTGTGKSFIAFKLVQENPQAKVCWLAPSEYIFNTQLENLKRALPEGEDITLSNICFLSYSRLMRNENSMGELRPDYIVLDEFHRCGAAEWGRSVRKLLELYPEAKVLGLSATNIRYLDGQRDMAQEIFQGNIASEMTLGEAIASGILAAPKYVIALYPQAKEIKRLEQRVKAMEVPGLADRNAKLIEQLRRALEQADGLDKVFYRHMTKRNGKYIVFCADKEHMDEMKEHVQAWFGRIDAAPHIYTAYYNSSQTDKDFAAFREDNSEHLKLLFCIDMLNEGVHVEAVDGVILLRPTISPIIYLQQIGRALSAGDSQEPLVFDLVSNFDGLMNIDCLEKELEEAFSMMPCTYGKRKKYCGKFQIIDEVRDCRRLFKQLQYNLSSSWDVFYQAAENYYLESGNLRIPKNYMTPEGLALGSWLQTQRRVYAGTVPGALTEEKIQKLNEIGMIWDVRAESWETGYQQLLTYYEKHGNADVKARYCSESGFPLGKWVCNLRASVKKKGIDKVLTPEQREKLDALGMIWDKNRERWDLYLCAAREYRESHGNLKIPAKYVTDDGLPLGNWFHAVKHGMSGDRHRAKTLSPEQIEQLEVLGIEWEKDNVTLWNRKFELAKEYYEQHGNLGIPVAYCMDGVRLGRWISNIRTKRRNPQSSGMVLDEKRVRQLDSIGMNWK